MTDRIVKVDKQSLLIALRERMQAKLDSLIEAQSTVQSGAIHEENRQEHPKDTRAIEAGYLARGLAERVETTADMVAALAALKLRPFGAENPVALGAVVVLEDERGAESVYFLVPAAGGEAFELQDETVHTVTPEAPLGRALIGRYLDDEVTLELPRGAVRSIISAVG